MCSTWGAGKSSQNPNHTVQSLELGAWGLGFRVSGLISGLSLGFKDYRLWGLAVEASGFEHIGMSSSQVFRVLGYCNLKVINDSM